VEGLQRFRREFRGPFWLEVIVVAGINDDDAGIEKIAQWSESIRPDRIHLNTVVRPPAEPFARAVPQDRLEKWRHRFRPEAEIIASFERSASSRGKIDESEIVAMVGRRPCTLQDIAAAFGYERHELHIFLEDLLKRGVLQVEQRGEDSYYRAPGL
jgi:wyosine [tRNA(Phe)-imidazoG37] synthetase (radical SAM superfamily)